MITTQEFKEKFLKHLSHITDEPIENTSAQERYEALVSLVTRPLSKKRAETSQRHIEEDTKKIYYFSMEFLTGPLLENYLLYLGEKDVAEQGLRELGINPRDIYACDRDPGLGNGGLGRLAACFLDSMASMGIAGVGMGLRYRFGLFKQRIESGFQIEEPDAWLEDGFPWEIRKNADAVEVKYGGVIDRHFDNGKLSFTHRDYDSVLAVPCDVPILGWGGKDVNVLRLWDAQSVHEEIDMNEFNHGNYSKSMKKRNQDEAITCFLYPNDSTYEGKVLRLKQEYFLVAAGMASIFKVYKLRHGNDFSRMPEYISIHTNDTHPALCVPEMMRILMDEEALEWDEAWDITTKVMSYTNHTVLPEALERWPEDLLKSLLPRIYMIIEEIDRRWRLGLPQDDRYQRFINATSIINGGSVNMADLSIIGAHHVNGVAALHTDILVNEVFKDHHELHPEKFNNKTNGISHRRFMIQSNPGLARLITEALGDGWQSDFDRIKALERFKDDGAFLDKLAAVKKENKERLAAYIAEKSEIAVDTNSVFDIQVKRIHAYKRQLLNALKVLDLYFELKDNPNLDINPYTFIFSGKAAASYDFAKETIKFICSVADLVNSDPAVREKIKVVFIENFSVSNAQLIYPAADISEQISTAGKEASGTGNMKFMMNGAVTLGTMDGANVEINRLVGYDNMMIFGLSAEEAFNLKAYGGYNSQDQANNDPRIKRLMEALVNGTFRGSNFDFWGIYDALLKHNDEYFVLKDFESYTNAFRELDNIYKNKTKWQQMSLINIARSSYFSSDRTIKEYADDIWHTPYRK